jgi:3D (Asp-Asp-Asp) domain-containing protein
MGFFLLSAAVSVVAPAHAAAPSFAEAPAFGVTLTGYNAVPAQTDSDPFITASGAYSNPEVVAARSRDLGDELPFGTIIEIDGPDASSTPDCGYSDVSSLIGYRVIADTMNERFTDHVDVLFPVSAPIAIGDGHRVNAANALGTCAGTSIKVVGHIDLTDPSSLPKTQEDLATIVHTQTVALQ